MRCKRDEPRRAGGSWERRAGSQVNQPGQEAPLTVVMDRLELPVEGITCASCAMRVGTRLNRLEGFTASVNYTTERVGGL